MSSRPSARTNGALREKSPRLSSQQNSRDAALPQHRGDVENGHRRGRKRPQKGMVRVKSAGESGRRGLHPLHFFKIVWRSTSWLSRAVNILWPIVPAAIAVHYALPERHTLGFILAYIAMVPCANLIGFAGQELARKMPHVLGVLVETTYVVARADIQLALANHISSTQGCFHCRDYSVHVIAQEPTVYSAQGCNPRFDPRESAALPGLLLHCLWRTTTRCYL